MRDHYWSLWSLPLRFAGFPFAFALGCMALLSFPLIREYAGAQEVLADGRRRRRAFPLREWFVTAARVVLPELR